MFRQFEKLSGEDRTLIMTAPVLVSVLAASGDVEISNNKKADVLKLVHLKTFTADYPLLSYYSEVEKNFVKVFEETVNKYAPFNETKRVALKKEINKLNAVIAKLDNAVAGTLHKRLAGYAEHVRKAERNILEDYIFPLPIRGLQVKS